MIARWWHCHQDTSSDRTPLARMLPSVIGSIGSSRASCCRPARAAPFRWPLSATSHLEVRGSHPRLDGPERVLHGPAAHPHLVRVAVEPVLCGIISRHQTAICEVGTADSGSASPAAPAGLTNVCAHSNLLVRGKPFGASRPASARLPRQSASSFSVSLNRRPAESIQVSPTSALNALRSDSPPSL
jgi:hypothetical protein